jgi:hypothetical protein
MIEKVRAILRIPSWAKNFGKNSNLRFFVFKKHYR